LPNFAQLNKHEQFWAGGFSGSGIIDEKSEKSLIARQLRKLLSPVHLNVVEVKMSKSYGSGFDEKR
jgi:hypothetical protein